MPSSPLTAADRFLLEQVTHGDETAWSQVVEKFQGRLVSFATQQLSNVTDAEDVVQETFLSFIRSLKSFREEASLETWLFGILRRRIIDLYRSRGRDLSISICSLQSDDDAAVPDFAATDPSASWYVRKQESHDADHLALRHALNEVVGRLRRDVNFRDLIVFELLFYAQQKNKRIAELVEIDEKQIALLKHRFLKKLAEQTTASHPDANEDSSVSTSLLTQLWESQRPSCPKRSTLGKFLLGSLDDKWNAYIAFHTEQLGCRFCQANLSDLENVQTTDTAQPLSSRIMNSTIGFLSADDS